MKLPVKAIYGLVFVALFTNPLFAQSVATSKYLLTEEKYISLSSPALQILGFCEDFFEYGYTCTKIATIQANAPDYEGILSIDPFISALAKAAADLGANAIKVGGETTINKNTGATITAYATAYRIVDGNGVLYARVEPTQEYIGKATVQYAKKLSDQNKAKNRLEEMEYYKRRQDVIREAFEGYISDFFAVADSTSPVFIETKISDLSAMQLEKLEKSTQRIPVDTVGKTLSRDSGFVMNEIEKIAVRKLKVLKGKYPKDYSEFRSLYKSVYSSEPEEQVASGPITKKSVK